MGSKVNSSENEEKPPARIRAWAVRRVSGLGEKGGPGPPGSPLRRLGVQGSAACHPGALKCAAGTRRPGGIWRPVRSLRHPRRLKPALAPSHTPGTGGRVGAAADSWHPHLVRTPQVLKAAELAERRGRVRLRAGAGGSAPPPCPGAQIPRSSWQRRPVPPLFFFRHWLRSSAGAQPGLVGRFAHGLGAQGAELRISFPPSPLGRLLAKPTFGLKSKIPQAAASCGVRRLPAESLYYTSLEGWKARPRLRRTPSISLLIGRVERRTWGRYFQPPAGATVSRPLSSCARMWTKPLGRWGRAVRAHAGLSRGSRCRVSRNPEPGCRWWSRGGRHLRHRDSGCSRWNRGPEHSQLMANDVRPWALSRLPVASQESPNDRFAALSVPLV